MKFNDSLWKYGTNFVNCKISSLQALDRITTYNFVKINKYITINLSQCSNISLIGQDFPQNGKKIKHDIIMYVYI